MKVKCPDFISRQDEKKGLAKAEGSQSVVPLCEDFVKKGEAGKTRSFCKLGALLGT
jgi:hypothetical protein